MVHILDYTINVKCEIVPSFINNEHQLQKKEEVKYESITSYVVYSWLYNQCEMWDGPIF